MRRESYSADSEFLIQGHWKRPGGRYEVPGDLVYSPGSIRLKLLGAFDDVEGFAFDRAIVENKPPIIHGVSASGDPITLLRSFYTHHDDDAGWRTSEPKPARYSEITSNVMLIGNHLNNESAEVFSSCSVTIPNLERWLHDHPFDVNVELDSINVKYKRPEDRTYRLSEEFGTLAFRYSCAAPGPAWDDATIRHRSNVTFEPPTPKSLDWFIRRFRDLEWLLTLLFGNVVQARGVELSADADPDGAGESEAMLYLIREPLELKDLHPYQFLTRYPDIEEFFPLMVSRWFTESEDIRPALNLVFASLEKPAPYSDTRFLPFVQAVEVFAREAAGKRLIDKKEFARIKEQVVTAIPDNVPSNLRQSIEARLAFANEPSLRERIRALLSVLEKDTQELLCCDIDEFVAGVVNTRNHFTHYSGTSKRVLDGVELYWATEKLKQLMRLLLLLRIGLPESHAAEIFRQDSRLTRERSVWRELSEKGNRICEKQ